MASDIYSYCERCKKNVAVNGGSMVGAWDHCMGCGLLLDSIVNGKERYFYITESIEKAEDIWRKEKHFSLELKTFRT